MRFGAFGLGEDSGRFDDVFGTGIPPRNVTGITLLVDFDLFAVDKEVAVGSCGDRAFESAVDRVVFEHVDGVGGVDEGVVGGDDLDIVALEGVAEDLERN